MLEEETTRPPAPRESSKATPKIPVDLGAPEHYLNRDLSLLEFNRRVLAQAEEESVPLLERLRFLGITTTNLDEFFEVRAASHKERVAYGATGVGFDGLGSEDVLTGISRSAHALVEDQYRVLNTSILPALEAEGIRVLSRTQWTTEQRAWITEYFRSSILPVLAPVGLDPAHPFPRILNKSLNFVVSVEGEDAFGRKAGLAVVQVPRAVPRIIDLPAEVGTAHDYILLSSVIHANVDELFPGMEVTGCHQFRVTRDGDLWVDEEEVEDVLKALVGELPERRYSEPVRLEVDDGCPADVADFLLERFGLGEDDLYRVKGPVNLHRLMALYDLVGRPDLRYAPFVPRIPRRVRRRESIFDAIRQEDIVLHHPYESFAPVLDLVRSAASDPDVLAIKQTLYRVDSDSKLVEALVYAARAGKQVTVVIELRARFDEEENIDLAVRLQDAGANVVYGVVGYKTHAKMLLIVRREGVRLRRYVHLGTGNYHAGTARAYTDIGFLTARKAYGHDVHELFNLLTGLGAARDLEKLLQSPFTLHKTLLHLIEQETLAAQRDEPARIVAKMNALTELHVIQALYRASQAGVRVDLMVRGACCLRPGVPGVSENIRVRSIIGRFLEHSRLFYFHAGGAGKLYCASADWMSRNLLRRVETCFPIEDGAIRDRLLDEDLEVYLGDDVQAWNLASTGEYLPTTPQNGSPCLDAQAILLERLTSSDDLQFESEWLEEKGLVLEIGARERMGGKPARRKGKSKDRARAGKSKRGKGESGSTSMKADGKPKKKG